MRAALTALPLLLLGCGSNTPVACTLDCAPGYHCQDGACVSDGPPDLAMGDLAQSPLGCTSDGQCPIGTYCKIATRACTLGCQDDARCGGGTMKCCGGRCLDASADPSNCGQCGKSCSAPNAQASCVGGQCAAGACLPGFGDCDGNKANGCETDTRIDPASCGGCGTACTFPNGVGACADGCYLAACNPGFDDCNGNATDGCETSVLADANNCGGCGKACSALPNAQIACASGNCGLGPCNQGFANCDGNPANGCEANLATDAKNCNQCGNVCPIGAPYCSRGVCINGCLAMGAPPPPACTTGMDSQTGAPWVVCQADCNQAWISQSTVAGGLYHALEICNRLGYGSLGGWDGDCGDVCGYCGNGNSCTNLGAPMFSRSPNSTNCGSDQFGPIICNTPQWQCLR
jgi:hypothetical protein